jgi:hypothetical protein
LRSDVFDRALPWTDLVWRRGLIDDLNLRIGERVSGLLALALVIALGLAPHRPAMLGVASAAALALLALNRDLYRFFWNERGGMFALGAIAWHWLYLVYSTVAFALGSIRWMLRRVPTTASRPNASRW